MKKNRCPWCENDALMMKYHDEEWGVPTHNDKKHFEFLVLEAAQAGLSWRTVLYKRENYRKAFSQFDPGLVARYNEQKIKILLQNEGIIRNRLKIESAIHNAKKFIEIQEEYGSFDAYLWSFFKNKPLKNTWKTLKELPSKTLLSDQISNDLKKRGFKFVGSTVIYAHLQAVGCINDHLINCFRYKEAQKKN